MDPSRNGADSLLQALSEQHVEIIFGYPGGAIMPVYDALTRSPIRHILARHEQGAAFAAMGYARASRRVGVCMVTSGPGATNTVTAIADAFLDSVPLVVICGQVATPLMGTDAFQEVDIFGITLPIVKHSFVVRNVEDVADTVHIAMQLALAGRKGPVLIDFPKDLQLAHSRSAARSRPQPLPLEAPGAPPADLQGAIGLMQRSLRPVLYVGGGVLAGNAIATVRGLAERLQLPTVCSLKGLGVLPTYHPQLLGMLGMHGNPAANLAVQQCDLLICAGARFDDRATGNLSLFAPHAQVIHMDIDAAEVGKLRQAQVALVGNLVQSLLALGHDRSTTAWQPWRDVCAALRQKHAWEYNRSGSEVCASSFIHDLSAGCGDRTFFTTDVGQHQMWAAQHCRLDRPEQFITSGGLGSMGYGLPAAIGAQLADPKARIICFSGDGSIMMNIQELATVKRYNLPIRIVLFDNQRLGMVRQWQELFFEERYSETSLHDNPDFCKLSEAFGIPAMTVQTRQDVGPAVERLLHEPGPLLCHVKLDPNMNVWPLVPPGVGNENMLHGGLT